MAGGKSDLPVRVASAAVMVAVAGMALWLGGWFWAAFVAATSLGVLREWVGLAQGLASTPTLRACWYLVGLVYVGVAGFVLALLGFDFPGWLFLVLIVSLVIATDTGAYFAGRAIGGPKIAPSISPSKTWAGLGGGIIASTVVLWIASGQLFHLKPWALVLAPILAVIAQIGDFFESWMKRRAGVKDSGSIIPGHGGLFDRFDGLLAVCFFIGLIFIAILIPPALNGSLFSRTVTVEVKSP